MSDLVSPEVTIEL